MRGRILHQTHPLGHIGTQRANLPGWMERHFEQPIAVKPLKLLTARHVPLSAGHVFYTQRIDPHHFQPPALQDLKDRNPVNADGLHGHCRNLTCKQSDMRYRSSVKLVSSRTGRLQLPSDIATKMAPTANVNVHLRGSNVLQVVGMLNHAAFGVLSWGYRFGLRKENRQHRTRRYHVRLFSKQDSNNSPAALKNGRNAPLIIRPPRSGYQLNSSRLRKLSRVTS